MVKSTLVALDIRLTIADSEPGANVIVVRDAIGAAEALQAVDRIQVALLELDPEGSQGCSLSRAVHLRGGKVVFLGDEAEDAGVGRDWRVLVRPFTKNCVLAALGG